MNKEFFKKNRNKYIQEIENKTITILFSGFSLPKSADQDFPFEVNKNFYYMTGIKQEQTILVIIKNDSKIEEMLFITENDPVLSKWQGKKITKEEASSISGIDAIHYLGAFDNTIFTILNNTRKSNYEIKAVYLDLERRIEEHVNSSSLNYVRKLQSIYPELTIKNAYNIIVSLRMIKDENEIEKIKESINTTKAALENVMLNIRNSSYEYQVQNYFDSYIRYNSNKENAFPTICASGKNATILHYTANDAKLLKDDLILLDLGCRSQYYVSDISRTYPISGKFSDRQKQVYEAVLRVNEACIAFLKPGLTWEDYNKYANSLLTMELKKLKIIQNDSDLTKYYYHSIGHMIGLDTHDPVLRNIPFKAGMVMTVEPGVYIEEEGIGVRIEDNILITETGSINLSKNIIKSTQDIENFMK